MKAKLFLTTLVLAVGCEKPPTNPPPPGLEQQQSTRVADSDLAKQPTVSGDAAVADTPPGRGTTETPATAFEQSDSGPQQVPPNTHPRVGSGGPGDKLDAEGKAVFQAAPGVKLKGEVTLNEVAGGVQLVVKVKNAPPGEKGIHIHQIPNCSDIPGKSMGEHFAPDAKEHGIPGTGAPHHLGDLGNLKVDGDGDGELKFVVQGANLRDHDAHTLIARSVVIHEKNDEGSQPSGNSGKPIACAIIKPE